MTFETIIFYTFAAIMLFAGLRVITARNPVHAALFLVLAFFTASAIWVLLQAEFLAITLVLVYVGAVMVLFLFVVMMLDINLDRLRKDFWSWKYWMPALFFAILLFVVALGAVGGQRFGLDVTGVPLEHAANYSNTKELGQLLYTVYVYPFELAAVLLLVAIVAAIALTHRGRKSTKAQDPGKQVQVKRNDRVRLVKMAAEKPATEAAAAADAPAQE